MERAYGRKVEPLADGWRSFAWSSGGFDTAFRPHTARVEGTIRTPHHLVLVTLSGAARAMEVSSACGHRYTGPDRAGAVSFVPAHCERQLVMSDVAARWASVSLSPTLFGADDRPMAPEAAFTNIEDAFAAALVGEMARLHLSDRGLDPTYCESMALALAHYLQQRYGTYPPARPQKNWKLAPWQVRRLLDHIESHLAEPIRIADLAAVLDLSDGHFFRAFRATVGKTPLDYINGRRVQRAMQLLSRGDLPLATIALRVGFVSPSHFARVFRGETGKSPSEYRAGLR